MELFKKKKNDDIQEKTIVQNVAVEEISNNELLDDCIEYISSQPKTLNLVERGIRSKESLLKEISKHLNMKQRELAVDIDQNQVAEVLQMFEKYIWGYHVLEDLINDKDITDIKIISKDNVRCKKFGDRYTSHVKFRSDQELERFINIVAIKNHINISDINAQQIFTDKETNKDFILRINISAKYVNSVNHSYLHIRKIPKKKYKPEDLVILEFASQEQMDYLVNHIKKGTGIIFTGKGASGKTTIMNTLLDEIPHNKCGLVIQESEELFSHTHPEMLFQKVRIAKGESKIEYTLMDLSINGLLIDLDYFIIGEIKGAEAKYLLNASYTGHSCLASVHGTSSKKALDKLVDYMKYDSDYSREDLLKMVSNIPIVVFMKNFKIAEISEVIGFDSEKNDLTYNQIYNYKDKINESIFKEEL